MKVLVISPQPFFSPRGTPFSVYYRSLVMSEMGMDIDLLTYGEGEDVDIPRVNLIRIPRFGWLGNVKTGPSVLKLFLDAFMIVWTLALLVRHRYDVVHAHEEAVFWVRFMKPVFRFKMVYDMHSSLPQQLTNFNFTTSRTVHRLFKSLEDSAIGNADAVITICPDLRDYVDSLGIHRGAHMLIENSIFEPVRLRHTGVPSPKQGNGEGAHDGVERGPQGEHVMVYAGTLEHYQGIGLLIDALPAVLREVPDAHLLIVGGSEDQVAKYREHARTAGVDSQCTFTGRVAKELADRYIASADVLLSPRVEGTNTPLKIYQQIASGIPLVATNIYSHTQVLNDEIAFLADPEASAVGVAMTRALRDRAEAQRRSANARATYEREYAREKYVEKMEGLFASLRKVEV